MKLFVYMMKLLFQLTLKIYNSEEKNIWYQFFLTESDTKVWNATVINV